MVCCIRFLFTLCLMELITCWNHLRFLTRPVLQFGHCANNGRFEPLRLFFAAGSWVLGPWLGVYLKDEVAPWSTFALAGGTALALFGFFWFLRLTENPAVAPAKGPPPNPLRYLPRFFGQPRLRLAWLLAVGRSGW